MHFNICRYAINPFKIECIIKLKLTLLTFYVNGGIITNDL